MGKPSLLKRILKRRGSSAYSISFYAKIIILVQTGIIGFFTFWIIQQYNSDQYFQGYVNTTVQANLVPLELGGTVATFLAALFFANLRRAQTGHNRIRLEVVGSLHQNQETSDGAKESGAPPALARAAVRVLKRIGPGQGALAEPLFQKNTLVLKEAEPEQPNVRPEASPEERKLRTLIGVSSRKGAGEKLVQRTITAPIAPLQQRDEIAKSPFEPRISQTRPAIPKPLSQTQPMTRALPPKPPTVITEVVSVQGPREKPPTPTPPAAPVQSDKLLGSGQGSTSPTPTPARPAIASPGPLENPVPDNALVPLLKRPSGDEAESRSPQPNPAVGSAPSPNRSQQISPGVSGRMAPERTTVTSRPATAAISTAANLEQTLATTKQALPRTPTAQPGSGRLSTLENSARLNPRPSPITVGPAPRTMEDSPGQRPLTGPGRGEPARGAMEKPSGFRSTGSSRTEPSQNAKVDDSKNPIQGTTSPVEPSAARKAYPKRPLGPKTVEHGDAEDS